jgi:transposase
MIPLKTTSDSGCDVDLRELKALELAARAKIAQADDSTWTVPSQSGLGTYRVVTWPGAEKCECEDFQTTGKPCKHVIAARLVEEREGKRPAPPMDSASVPKRKTYGQDWPAYNLAQTTEKDRFQELLADLCAGVQEPPRHKKGGRRTWVRDAIFACAYKVYSTFSGRRFACDLRDAHKRGYLLRPVSPSMLPYLMESDAMTPVLYQLIERSALPLRSLETTFAPDSTGFSTSRFVRWYDEKYGQERSGRAWVKCHAMTGVKTNVITTAIIDSPTANDMPFFRPMLEQTLAGGFDVRKMCADKGYLSRENLDLAAKHGAVAFIPFKVNSVPGEPGSVWDQMFGLFQFRRAEFLQHYHARSNVESTFAMVKAKFQDSVRSRTDTAMKNEVLLKLLCHNVVVVHQSIVELGIDGEFWPSTDDGTSKILPLMRRG